MDCATCREVLSARLDGEDLPGEAVASDAHLAGCARCRAFHEQAARVTRLTRTRLVDPSGPRDLLALDLPPVVPARTRLDVLRALLAAAGIAQLALGVSGLLDAAAAGQHGGLLGGAGLAHLGHESAAWNLAVGVGFLAVALRAARPAGSLVAMLGAFTAVLLLTSGIDVVSGRVGLGRLAGHTVLVTGLVVLVVLGRRGPGDDRRHRAGRPAAHRAPLVSDDAPVAPVDAGPGYPDLRPSARRAA
ncbi:zf-HC2 domain-containing protein [Pseudonocardia dioxanivorans]|jgi:predicted anti-sigma-YlaC factor YlaD|uniref:zf-HC2 domain-containing protein n=1 Tax=Pseudonocardia dioxanivorans TaxID=240495 RepID=UPI000CD1FD1D|nr:zf-HC2 domain-containing protein [Pseudonocardia dioxanivorans]